MWSKCFYSLGIDIHGNCVFRCAQHAIFCATLSSHFSPSTQALEINGRSITAIKNLKSTLIFTAMLASHFSAAAHTPHDTQDDRGTLARGRADRKKDR
jgi:hypothetical protein